MLVSNQQEDKMADTDISNLTDNKGNRVDNNGMRIITFGEAKELVAQGRAEYMGRGLDPQCLLQTDNGPYVAVHCMPYPGYRQLDKPTDKAQLENRTR